MEWFIQILNSFVNRYVIADQRDSAREGLGTIIKVSEFIVNSQSIFGQIIPFNSLLKAIGVKWEDTIMASNFKEIILDFKADYFDALSLFYESNKDKAIEKIPFKELDDLIYQKLCFLYDDLYQPSQFYIADLQDCTRPPHVGRFCRALNYHYGLVLHKDKLYFIDRKNRTRRLIPADEFKAMRSTIFEELGDESFACIKNIRLIRWIEKLTSVSLLTTTHSDLYPFNSKLVYGLIGSINRKAIEAIHGTLMMPNLETRLSVCAKLLDVLTMQSRWTAKAFNTAFLGLMMIYLKGEDDLFVQLSYFNQPSISSLFAKEDIDLDATHKLVSQQKNPALIDFYQWVSQISRVLTEQQDEEKEDFFVLTERAMLKLIDFNISMDLDLFGRYCKRCITKTTLRSILQECRPNQEFYHLLTQKFQLNSPGFFSEPKSSIAKPSLSDDTTSCSNSH